MSEKQRKHELMVRENLRRAEDYINNVLKNKSARRSRTGNNPKMKKRGKTVELIPESIGVNSGLVHVPATTELSFLDRPYSSVAMQQIRNHLLGINDESVPLYLDRSQSPSRKSRSPVRKNDYISSHNSHAHAERGTHQRHHKTGPEIPHKNPNTYILSEQPSALQVL